MEGLCALGMTLGSSSDTWQRFGQRRGKGGVQVLNGRYRLIWLTMSAVCSQTTGG